MNSELRDVLGLLEKATPGEWEVDECRTLKGARRIWSPSHSYWVGEATDVNGNPENEANAAAIVAAVNWLRTHGPALLDEQPAGDAVAVGEVEACYFGARDPKVGRLSRFDLPVGTKLYTHPPREQPAGDAVCERARIVGFWNHDCDTCRAQQAASSITAQTAGDAVDEAMRALLADAHTALMAAREQQSMPDPSGDDLIRRIESALTASKQEGRSDE